jgi:prepilin-type N-terminal cleavage/methylation domain-containing protein
VRGRRGFSLPEALIALTISSILVMLVGAVFLAQNDFYAHVLLRSQVQENARAMTQLVADEVRSIGDSAIIIADSSRLVLRQPIATFAVCGRSANDVYVMIPGGTQSFTTADVSGIGRMTPTGAWTWHDVSWGTLLGSGGNPKQDCYANGADTVDASFQFYKLTTVNTLTGITAANLFASTFVIYSKTEFKFDDSILVDGTRALYRGRYGSTLTELATGLSTAAHFEYWTGSAWSKAVSGATLANITRVRLVAQSEGVGETSQQAGYDFGWTVDIPVANAL